MCIAKQIALISSFVAVLATSAKALPGLLDDGQSHAPPTTGTFAYNSFSPANTGGTEYMDPVFGSTIRRLTTDHAVDDMYARNMWWNADGSKYYHKGTIIDTKTGAVTHTVPDGDRSFDAGFDSIDPNVVFYIVGSAIHKVTLGAAGTKTDIVYLTLPAAAKSLGGTINWLDAGGHYLVARYGAEPSIHVYDRQNLAAGPFSGGVSGTNVEDGGYIGLTPDGKYVVSGTTAWPLNPAARTLSTTGTMYWDLCGDHGIFVSASDGRNYKVTSNCNLNNEIWRVDITNNVGGQSEDAQKAAPGNKRLLASIDWDIGLHYSAVAKGPLQDWAFASMEANADDFNSSTNPWLPYRSEIIALNVMTGEVRRLAHHRSRAVDVDYSNQPRLSCSWGGEMVGWASNFNQNGVVDIFALPFSSGSTGTSACDLNQDQNTNIADVQLCVNQAINPATCGSGDIDKNGSCNVIDVQRVVNAALGGSCDNKSE